ncbi:glycerol kinase GlpK [Pediococcus acidilactici]|uniref:glycerol kinase GlpK n=1 Tax=Pediococcus acidilactici TaxID=1254 RepID=UPI00190F2F02|nr:glycerol kinase GlpK [Pediococcus acidilactici]
MKQKYILSIDAGTSVVKTVIFNHASSEVVSFSRELSQESPHQGWYEQSPEDIWKKVYSSMANALIVSGISPKQIAGIGITNQRETTIIWNKRTGKPIYNAIMWRSRQTNEITDSWNLSNYKDLVKNSTGLVLDSYFSASKIRWILDHVPHAQQQAENGELLFGTVETWLLWKLTNGHAHVTDYTNASRTMFFNIRTLDWDEELLKALNIPIQLMPEVRSNSEIFGYTIGSAFFNCSVPIAGMIGDQQSSLVGQLAFHRGAISAAYGTGAFITVNTGENMVHSENNLLTTVSFGLDKKIYYGLEGNIFVAGTAVTWLQDSLEMIKDPLHSAAVASQSTNDNLYVVTSFNGMGAPYWDEKVQGAVFGMTDKTTKADFVRATLQSIAYRSKDVILAMQEDMQAELQTVYTDGSMAKNDFLMQFEADILGVDVNRSETTDIKALGVAFLAGLAVGFWEDLTEIKKLRHPITKFQPVYTAKKRERLYRRWQRAVLASQIFSKENE